MTRRTFEVSEIVEILMHWHAGRKKAVVAESLGVDRGTVHKYVAKAEAAGLAPGGPPLTREEWARLVLEWFPELVDPRRRSRTHDAIEAHRAQIEEMLTTNTVTTVHQRLRDEHGLAVGLTSFRRYVWLELPGSRSRELATPHRPDVAPGEEAQIDYGYLGTWLDPVAQRLRRVWAFVMVLACSRHMFVRPVLKMDQLVWTACHVAAFELFGAVPRRLVPDNLKTGVDRPDLYDPKLNRSYADLAAHYGCLIDPARGSKPKDKPRVERQMPYVRDSMWRGRTWTSEAEMATDAVRWCTEVAGVRPHRSLDGASPLQVFRALEAPAMLCLPAAPFELAAWSSPKVGPDCYVKVAKALYSVPWRLIGTRVDAREGERTVEIYVGGDLVKTWERVERGKRTDYGDYPPEKVAFFMRTPMWCKTQAAELGPSVKALVEALLEGGALYRLRQAQGVIRLGDRHPDRLDAACRRAIEVGDPTYRTVKGILAAGTEGDGAPEAFEPDAPAHLHGPTSLLEHLEGATG